MSLLKVGIAMSGGVDSTVAASLLLEKGCQVHGFFMMLPLANLDGQIQRVQEVADSLSIPLHLIDLRQQFSDQVIRYFIEGYQAGQTPNPCVFCNHTIKFGILAKIMLEQGMDRIATGHYARVRQTGPSFAVYRGADRRKDQSYFLARLSSAQLAGAVFPLGDWTKEQVYRRAQALGFSFAGEESQDICFLGHGLSAFFAEQGVPARKGTVVTPKGTVLGEHCGVWNYTIGQRRGLGLPDATPWYVVGIDGRENRIIVGKEDDLLQSVCTLHALQWTHTPLPLPWRGHIQLRSRHAPAAAQVRSTGDEHWQVSFETPQRAVTPGQFAVLYEGDQVLGSAVIGQAETPGGGTPL